MLLSTILSFYDRAVNLDLVKDMKIEQNDVYIIHYLDKLLEEMQENE